MVLSVGHVWVWQHPLFLVNKAILTVSKNGFLAAERYFDDPLKQRLKEESYERSVLNSLNQEKIEELMESIPQIVLPEMNNKVERQQIDEFFAKEKVKKDIIGIQVGETDVNTENKKKNDNDDDDLISVP